MTTSTYIYWAFSLLFGFYLASTDFPENPLKLMGIIVLVNSIAYGIIKYLAQFF